MTGNVKQKSLTILAIAVILAILVGGTFAWQDYRQHKTNVLSDETAEKYDVRLVEKFSKVDKWRITNPNVEKIVNVKNLGKASSGYGEVYVRLQLKEYMEIAKPKTTSPTNIRYAIDTTGNFVIFKYPDTAQGELDAIAARNATVYKDFDLSYQKDVVTGEEGWFVKSGENQIHGQYGKFLPYDTEYKDAESLVIGVERADEEVETNHQVKPNGECTYTKHDWLSGLQCTANPFAEYVRMNFSTDIISYTDWVTAGANACEKWIYDNRADSTEGWVYWGQALNPQSTTKNFLESVTLLKQPEGPFYYAIHVEMEALSIDELISSTPQWAKSATTDGIPPALITAYRAKYTPTTTTP